MDVSAGPEPVNQEGFAALAARAGDGSPVVMLNLLRFEPGGGRERYGEYGAAVAPLLERAGGRVVFVGEPATVLLGEALTAGELHPLDAVTAEGLP